LESAFQSVEATSVVSTSEFELQAEQSQHPSQPQEADLLARTAGLLVQSVDHEKNPKFANSQFLGLMKQLRDRTAIVEGNDIVAAPLDWQLGQEHTVPADLKGKGKAAPSSIAAMLEPRDSQSQASSAEQAVPADVELDENEAYFRQDNEDYAKYWKAHHAPVPPVVSPTQEWQQLQRDWERFEATTPGVMPVAVYRFQPGNPYLLGEWSRNHSMHGDAQMQPFSEVCDFRGVCFQNL
jgi:peroxin-5